MDLSFYTAAVGAYQQQLRLDVHGNNIANINNFGFRARRPSFVSLMTGAVQGINEDLARGVGSRLESDEADFRGTGVASSIEGTGRDLDYAINGSGFFALMDPATGEFSYTRDGSFTLSEFKELVQGAEGEEEIVHWYLSDGLGRFVLGKDGRPIDVTDQTVEQPIGIFDFINYNGMKHVGDDRFEPVDKNGQVGVGSGTLIHRYLEMSNADLAYEFAKVIESQRSFSYMLRMVQTSDEITSTVNNLR